MTMPRSKDGSKAPTAVRKKRNTGPDENGRQAAQPVDPPWCRRDSQVSTVLNRKGCSAIWQLDGGVGIGKWNWSRWQGASWSLETRFVERRHGPESVLSWWREISEEALAFAPGCIIGQGTQCDLDESDGQQASVLTDTQPLLPATVTNPGET